MFQFKDAEDLKFSVTQRGNSFFHHGWMRAKGTRVTYTPEWGDLFITSEYKGADREARAYTVRQVVPAAVDSEDRLPITALIHSIDTQYQNSTDGYLLWPTLAAAKKHLKAYQKHLGR